jgi:hypothetical protein
MRLNMSGVMGVFRRIVVCFGFGEGVVMGLATHYMVIVWFE